MKGLSILYLVLLVILMAAMSAGAAPAATLVWDPSSGTVDGYLVEISTDGGATWAYRYAVIETQLDLNDKCQFNTGYQFRVSAYNNAGISAPCDPITWSRPPYTPPADNPLPPVNGGVQPGTVAGAGVK